jgi:hypothetical protein
MDCSALRDWTSFHSEFSRVFGFPAFYGKNMDAWIDCMTSLDKPENGMSTVHCATGSILTLELNNASDFEKRCPEQYKALIHCSEFVNRRRIEAGEAAVLTLDLKSDNQSPHTVLFAIGCVAALLAFASAICSWTSPFPLVPDGQGGFSLNPMGDRVLLAGLLSALAASILGAFCKGKLRLTLVLSGPLLAVCSLLGWLGNHR